MEEEDEEEVVVMVGEGAAARWLLLLLFCACVYSSVTSSVDGVLVYTNCNTTSARPLPIMEVFLVGLGVAAGVLGYKMWTVKKMTVACPPSGPVPQNKTRICIAGSYGPHDARAHKIASTIAAAHPDKFVMRRVSSGAARV